jgi:hypothetical protein
VVRLASLPASAARAFQVRSFRSAFASSSRNFASSFRHGLLVKKLIEEVLGPQLLLHLRQRLANNPDGICHWQHGALPLQHGERPGAGRPRGHLEKPPIC